MDLRSTVFCCCCFFFIFLVTPETIFYSSFIDCMLNTTAGTSVSSTFKRNLNVALSNLTSLSSRGTKYATTSAGSAADNIVFAMFQCRGDQTLETCRDCVANATVRLPEKECPNYIGARIQYDDCYLRYDNQSFFTPNFSRVTGLCNDDTTSDPTVLRAVDSVMKNVTTLAPKQGGYASAIDDGIYGLAQCLGYLNESECSQCLLSESYRDVCTSITGEGSLAVGQQLHLASCYYHYESRPFFNTNETTTSPSPSRGPLPTAAEAHHGSKPPIAAVIGGVVGAIVAIVALCLILSKLHLVRLHKARQIRGGESVDKGAGWSGQLLETKAHVFLLQELEEATMNFHPNNKLGQGGYGPVYKGTLSDGTQVAVKKLAIGSRQGRAEFLNEVNIITSVQHKNLVKLLGCCMEGSERILVYEFLPNQSLDFFLFGETVDDKVLDWSTRFGIVLGMANGLKYLHEESQIHIIHRDIKPSNILLDNQLNPIIADFGLARLVKDDESQINTRPAGTLGYLAPEYVMHGKLSAKVDVFSFGLVSLEIISGRKNLISGLLQQVWDLYLQNNVLNLVDSKLGMSFVPEEAIRIIHIALLCTQENPTKRPTMSTVTTWLLANSKVLEIPNKPAFLEMDEIRASSSAMNYQWSPRSSSSSTLVTNSSRDKVSHLSGGIQSISVIDPR